MSRYRKVYVRVWGDEKFRSLSAPNPNGQTLWFFLMTGPHTGPIPGVFCAGKAGLAESLGWSLKSFRKIFREIFAKRMAKADWKARLVFLPKAINYNRPESPNVVKSWRQEFDELPECELKQEIYQRLTEFLESLGPAFLEAFTGKPSMKSSAKPFIKPSEKPLSKTLPNQEQEQEQEGLNIPVVPSLSAENLHSVNAATSATADGQEANPIESPIDGNAATSAILGVFRCWNSQTATMHHRSIDGQRKAIAKALRKYSPDEICRAIERYNAVRENRSGKYRQIYAWTLGEFLTRHDHYNLERFNAENWEAPFVATDARTGSAEKSSYEARVAEKLRKAEQLLRERSQAREGAKHESHSVAAKPG